jgi:hypothetical protein
MIDPNDRYKNLSLNCEYEFELFVEFNERFHKVAIYQSLNISYNVAVIMLLALHIATNKKPLR